MTMRCKRVVPDPSILRCEHCGESTRPSVLMFRIDLWIKRTKREQRYVDWEAQVENQLKRNEKSTRLVVIGDWLWRCNLMCDFVSEMVVEDILRTQIGHVLLNLYPLTMRSHRMCVVFFFVRIKMMIGVFLLERRDDDAEIASGQLTCFWW